MRSWWRDYDETPAKVTVMGADLRKYRPVVVLRSLAGLGTGAVAEIARSSETVAGLGREGIESLGWEVRCHSPGSAFLVCGLSRRARIAKAGPDRSKTSKEIHLR